MPLILNIETATEVCSVCISKGKKILALKETTEKNSHASRITIMIEECLQIAGVSLKKLDAVAISEGPGSYTGLRVGSSTAKGICYALNKPLITVSTLQALAAAAHREMAIKALYVPMIDARRMEVYTATYDDQNQRKTDIEALIINEDSFQMDLNKGHTIVLCGNGASKCQEVLNHPQFLYSSILCSAAHMVDFSAIAFQENHFSDMAYYSPFYFKSPNITRSKKNIL